MALNTPFDAHSIQTEHLRLVITPYQLFVTAFWQKDRLIRLILSINPDFKQKYEKNSHLSSMLQGLLMGEISPLELDISYSAKGSEFSVEVWATLFTIPYGETTSYKDLAQLLNTSPRAIGQALKTNPLPIIIPCHRVLGAQKALTGFSCGLEVKKILLAIEDRQRRANENSHHVRQP